MIVFIFNVFEDDLWGLVFGERFGEGKSGRDGEGVGGVM